MCVCEGACAHTDWAVRFTLSRTCAHLENFFPMPIRSTWRRESTNRTDDSFSSSSRAHMTTNVTAARKRRQANAGTDTHRQRHTRTQTHTDTHRHTQTSRQTYRRTQTHRDTHRHTQTNRQTYRRTHAPTQTDIEHRARAFEGSASM